MSQRQQRTIGEEVEAHGTGLFTGAEVTLRFVPAPAGSGIVFQRVDLPGMPRIPGRIEYAVQLPRRTVLACDGARVEMVEHIMAAFYGLQVDNCLVQLNGPEIPGFDGSCQAIVDCLSAAGFVEQDGRRPLFHVLATHRVVDEQGDAEAVAQPMVRPGLAVSYQLDYGPRSVIPAQNLTVLVTPESFRQELAAARTFILESEITALRAQGYGLKTTTRDLLVFGRDGVVDNELHWPDECARHKILDCIGDFALGGCDLSGHFSAYRSGHRLNRELIHRLRSADGCMDCTSHLKAA